MQAKRGPPGSYARLEYLTSLAFGFRDPEAYLIAKEVLQAIDVARSGGHMDLNPLLGDCADDIIRQLRDETVEVR